MDETLYERVLELFQSEEYLSLRYKGVAERLRTGSDETLDVMHDFLNSGVLFRKNGYYQLNPPHLWGISLE